ncbi:hypothetical protein HELRODRAFT_183696 [Helobdella robusta]|uniref:Uncharacterized protein n=1 Tax=Helobdella robusta TaxID=6412 RepID=T1FK23_HELRO|nr:hypothetical protein HELRODRAFT_183696 [Helobdella robusta]ESO10373.1 hypothetical protein HELRODRAFT_183696 [Helobdella robusta]
MHVLIAMHVIIACCYLEASSANKIKKEPQRLFIARGTETTKTRRDLKKITQVLKTMTWCGMAQKKTLPETPNNLERLLLISDAVENNHFFSQLLLEKIQKVTVIDLNNVVQKYVSQLIDPLNSRMVIICPPKEIMKLVSKFQTLLNCNFDVYKNINAFNTE